MYSKTLAPSQLLTSLLTKQKLLLSQGDSTEWTRCITSKQSLVLAETPLKDQEQGIIVTL
jgi:hypothetical protein